MPEFPRYIQITCTVFYVFIFLLGVLGNVLVVVVVCLNRNMKTAVNIYLINLCVADLLVLTVCMPTALADVYARDIWYFGSLMCKYRLSLQENTIHFIQIIHVIHFHIHGFLTLRALS